MKILFMSTPLGDGHIIFAFSVVRHPSRLISGHFKEKYLSYVYHIWYGCVYWVNSLHGIAFGEDSSVAN